MLVDVSAGTAAFPFPMAMQALPDDPFAAARKSDGEGDPIVLVASTQAADRRFPPATEFEALQHELDELAPSQTMCSNVPSSQHVLVCETQRTEALLGATSPAVGGCIGKLIESSQCCSPSPRQLLRYGDHGLITDSVTVPQTPIADPSAVCVTPMKRGMLQMKPDQYGDQSGGVADRLTALSLTQGHTYADIERVPATQAGVFDMKTRIRMQPQGEELVDDVVQETQDSVCPTEYAHEADSSTEAEIGSPAKRAESEYPTSVRSPCNDVVQETQDSVAATQYPHGADISTELDPFGETPNVRPSEILPGVASAVPTDGNDDEEFVSPTQGSFVADDTLRAQGPSPQAAGDEQRQQRAFACDTVDLGRCRPASGSQPTDESMPVVLSPHNTVCADAGATERKRETSLEHAIVATQCGYCRRVTCTCTQSQTANVQLMALDVISGRRSLFHHLESTEAPDTGCMPVDMNSECGKEISCKWSPLSEPRLDHSGAPSAAQPALKTQIGLHVDMHCDGSVEQTAAESLSSEDSQVLVYTSLFGLQ